MAREYDEYTEGAINDMYNARRDKQLRQLESSYLDAVKEVQRGKNGLSDSYNAARNDLAADYERSRKSSNEQFAARGISSGAGTQAAMAQRSEYMRGMGRLSRDEAAAKSDADARIEELGDRYRREVNSAIAENDYNRAAALYQEYQNAYDRRRREAAELANYGNFSGYGSIYGDGAADGMKQVWNASNPDIAYYRGEISPEEYYRLTGRDPR